MKQVIIKQGQAVVEDVPAPRVEPGTVLVRVDHSCISIGTEMSGVRSSGLPLWKRALRQPENVKKGMQMVAAYGVSKTWSVVEGRLSAGSATGYSAAGTVVEVGDGVHDLAPGDRVACAGAQHAHHAEFIRVPRNLVVPVPDELGFPIASTVTLGAIALQGVRRARPTLGETFVIVGLGVLGQLVAQLLKANGCRVIATDLDRTRVSLALEQGADLGVHPDDGDPVEQVARLTGGIGADGVIVTAATPSHEVVSTAFRMSRKKGRVVLVGDVGLHLNRADFYEKELDFLISTSYGPGRYDRRYEEEGLDYPVAYVRWTENRNMEEYLRLAAEGRIRVDALVSKVFPIDEAPAAYSALESGAERPLMVLLSYPGWDGDAGAVRKVAKVRNPRAWAAGPGALRLALVGAGGFAKGMHLPNLQSLHGSYHLRAVVSRTGHNAIATARQFGADYATTDYAEVLKDSEVDVVLLATRHNLHASMALDALAAGKHVLVEKPLAVTREELASVRRFFDTVPDGRHPPVLLTGFNRRFSPIGVRLRELTMGRSNPMVMNYRMNAGRIPLDHWVHTAEGGGRNIGEACHIYDLFTFLADSPVKRVTAHAVAPSGGYYSPRDNFVATLSFEDGSVATLTYTAMGAKDHPKEQMEVYVDGRVVVMDDYKRLVVQGARSAGLGSKVPDKGQKAELEAFAKAVRGGGEWPIPLWQQLQAMEIAYDVEDQIGGGV